jgi:hypothetical protein
LVTKKVEIMDSVGYIIYAVGNPTNRNSRDNFYLFDNATYSNLNQSTDEPMKEE